MGKKKRIVHIPPPVLRTIIVCSRTMVFQIFPNVFLDEYLAEDRITALDVLPREFGLMPTRMSQICPIWKLQ
jgi:NADH dehydrogenase